MKGKWFKRKPSNKMKTKLFKCPHLDNLIEFPYFCYYEPKCKCIQGKKCCYGKKETTNGELGI